MNRNPAMKAVKKELDEIKKGFVKMTDQHRAYEAYRVEKDQQKEAYEALRRKIWLMPVQLVVYVHVP